MTNVKEKMFLLYLKQGLLSLKFKNIEWMRSVVLGLLSIAIISLLKTYV